MKTAELVSKYRHTFNTDYTADANCVVAFLVTESSGTTIQDATSNNIDGTLASSGHPGFSSTVPDTFVSHSLDCDSTSSVAVTSAALDLTSGTDTISGVFWVKTSATDAAVYTNRKNGDGNPIIDFVIGNNGAANAGTGKPSIIVRGDNGSGLVWLINGTAVNNNVFHHIAFTINSSKHINTYVDGVGDTGTDHSMTSGVTTDQKYFGDELQNAAIPNFVGLMAEPAIFSDVLTSTEINEIMDYGLKPTSGVATGFMTCMKMW